MGWGETIGGGMRGGSSLSRDDCECEWRRVAASGGEWRRVAPVEQQRRGGPGVRGRAKCNDRKRGQRVERRLMIFKSDCVRASRAFRAVAYNRGSMNFE
jgi:hypothetical protein